ncbi:MAG: gliding motility-associated C-terminal domain-containing protein [Chitinophagia bacterium]|nr:gliding motility-associated C-terminal domain-containing protein [Chitinophagia bacterium]
MKLFSRFLFFVVAFVASAITCVKAQMVSDCVFLQGRYVEVGIAPNGGYGSTVDAPGGYHPFLTTGASLCDPARGTTVSSTRYLGFVADYGRDGWTTGTPPFFGDYYLPGTPQEGWAIQVGSSVGTAYIPYFQTGCTGYGGGITGSVTGYSSSGGVSKGVWQGSFAGLSIRQTTSLDTNDLFFLVKVVLKNTTSAPISGIFYERTLDPDNEQTRSGSFTTTNTITYQLPNLGNKVLVSAVGGTYSSYLGLGTKDCRAKCSIFNSGLFPNCGPDSMWRQLGAGNMYTSGTTYVNDVGIALVYNIGTIAAGDSTSFVYTYILNASYIDSALNATQPGFYLNSSSFNTGDTVNLCTYSLPTMTLSVDTGGAYIWHWSPVLTGMDSTATSNTINVSSLTGTITFTIMGTNRVGGCDTIWNVITLDRNPYSITLTNRDTTICIGNSVRANVTTSATTPISYVWSPAMGVSNTTAQNPLLTPTTTTTYYVTGSSATGGCPPTTRSFVINVVAPPASINLDSVYVKTCVGVPVTLHARPVPGGSYSYTWSPATGLSNATVYNPTVTPSVTGDVVYTVTVGHPTIAGCSARDTLRVHTVPNDFILYNRDTAICRGNAVVGNLAGWSEFTYRWSPATGVSNVTRTNPTIRPDTSTYYTVTASYAACPPMVHGFNIEVDTLAPVLHFADTFCLGGNTNFDVRVAGTGTGSNYYHYQWSPVGEFDNDTIPNPVITPTATGTRNYAVSISPHALGCTTVSTVDLLVLPNSISIEPHDTSLCLGQNLQVRGNAFSLFRYQWLPTSGISRPNSFIPYIRPDTSQTYIVTATYPRCPPMRDTLRLHVDPNPNVFVGGNKFVCRFDTMHLRAVVTPEWFTGYRFIWTPGQYIDDSTKQNVIFNGPGNTKLYAIVTTPAGCRGIDSLQITVYPGNFGGDIPDQQFCPGDTAVLITNTTFSGVKYHWYPHLYLSDSISGSPTFKPIASASYTVVAITPEGCTDTLHFNAIVHQAAVLSVPDTVILHSGEVYNIRTLSNCVSYNWFPTYGLDNPTAPNPNANPQASVVYTVTGVTDKGCKATDEISFIVDKETIVTLPNAFTPGNGINNRFRPDVRGILNVNHLRVFNRWGNLLYDSKDMHEGWDGTYNGEPQPMGVYVYELQAVTNSGKTVTKRGNVTLIR